MTLYALSRTQILPISIGDAWAYFSDPNNLCDLTPEWLCFDIRSNVPPTMHPGMIIEYRITALAGIPMNWITEITHVVEPTLFVDEQRFGPYRFWHHQHHFREIDRGVEMYDLVHYSLPFGPLGSLMHALHVRKKLREIFNHRQEHLKVIFPG
jgi:ligand-binding SRPBCC domain-containing protein